MVKNIVILGAGFAGLKVAQDLSKSLNDPNYKIILIDKSDKHIYRSDLYEVATAFNKRITKQCLSNLSDTIATPIKELIDPKKVKYIKDEVVKIHPGQVQLSKRKPIKYTYLVIALGTVTNYFHVPGLKENSFPLKDIEDGLAINCHLDQHLQSLWEKKDHKDINIVIGGGGATGVETSAELVGAYNKLAKKYKYPRNKIHIHLIEGQNLLGGMQKKGTRIIKKRLKKLGVKLYMKSLISKVTKKEITLKGKKSKLPYDTLIWTGGVKIPPVLNGKAITVRPTLQTLRAPSIFAAGDNAFFPDQDDPTKRLPMLARTAFEQGKVIAKNITRSIEGKPLKTYKKQGLLYILPIGQRYAIFKTENHLFQGRLMWYIRRIVFLKYSLSILPFFKGLRKWAHGTKIFIEND